jgi:CubicO group peptidase (beta-lactamase class C family)
MKFFLPVFLLITSLSALTQDLAKKFDDYLLVTNGRNKFNGTALIVYKEKILLYKGYGYKNTETKVLNDTNTIFRIGSITKPFTSTVILNLLDKNLLSLQDPLNKYIPDYPHGNDITIQNLLTHTSGIAEYLFIKGFDREDESKPINIDRLIGYFKNEKLDFAPGAKWSYSNSNYILLAYIIEKITGKKYESVARDIIIGPLQMEHTGFDFRYFADTNKATGYTNIYKKKPVSTHAADSSFEIGCGSIYATVMDLYKFDRSFYTDKILRPETLHQAITPFKSNYGYGWFIDTAYQRLNVFHGGGIPGFVASLQRFPSDDLCIVLLSNNSYCDLSEMSNKLAAIIFDMRFEKALY